MDIKELTSDFAKPGRRILKSESMITSSWFSAFLCRSFATSMNYLVKKICVIMYITRNSPQEEGTMNVNGVMQVGKKNNST